MYIEPLMLYQWIDHLVAKTTKLSIVFGLQLLFWWRLFFSQITRLIFYQCHFLQGSTNCQIKLCWPHALVCYIAFILAIKATAKLFQFLHLFISQLKSTTSRQSHCGGESLRGCHQRCSHLNTRLRYLCHAWQYCEIKVWLHWSCVSDKWEVYCIVPIDKSIIFWRGKLILHGLVMLNFFKSMLNFLAACSQLQ